VYIGGDEGTIYGIDTLTHEIIDVWNLYEPISALDVSPSTKDGCVIVAGTGNGRIYMRVDWQ
jgi:hypothetical protein